MKEQQARTGSAKRSSVDSVFAALIDSCESLMHGEDFRRASAEFEKELKRLTGASSISLFLPDSKKPELCLFSSSDESAHHVEVSIPANREPVKSLRRSRHPTYLSSKSKYFSDFKETIFSGAVVDSINIYPIRFGTDFQGLLVAAFWKADGGEAETAPSDNIFTAAAKQLSLVIQSIQNESKRALVERKYSAALSQLTAIVFVFDLSTGKLTEANEVFFKSFGYEKSDLGHLTLFDLVFEPKEEVEANIKHGMEAGRVFMPSKLYKRKNGSGIEMEVRGTNITFNGGTYAVVTAVDLTERRKAEMETELQRERYENFIRTSSDGIWRIDFSDPVDITKGTDNIAKDIAERSIIAECNRAFAQMYGFDAPDQLIGRQALDFIADLDAYTASKLKFTEQNFSVANIETIERDRHGNIHYFENSYIGETKNSMLVRMWGIQRDITEKRKLEEQLRMSENRYRNLVEQANDLVLLFGKDGEFLFANKKFFEQTGYSSEEIWGKSVTMIAHPEDAGELARRMDEQLRSPEKHLRHTLRFITKFNEEKIVELGMTTLRLGDSSSGILAIGRDVTVEQSVKLALHESEEKYRSLVEHSLFGVLVVQDGVIVYANQTSGDLFETELSSLQGTPLSGFIHPNDYAQLFTKFEEAALAPNRDVQFSVRGVTATGKIKSIEGWAAGITYMAKPAIQIATVDVTDTKRLKEQLFQSQKMESIGQLASGVAHDFNNLLGSIYGAIEILRKRYASHDPSLTKYVDVLDTSARRAAELTSQLLTFSRQRESDVMPLRLNDTVNDAMKILFRSIGKNIKVEYSLDPTLYNVEADPSQIEGIIINLSINARDAMPAGGTLRIETSNADFDSEITSLIPDARPGSYACLSITDNGVGMDEATRQKIFEPFFTTKPIGKGTGLGLSIVYGIVKNHKGFISVHSEPGQGTTFKIFLPATDKAPADDVMRVPKEVPRGTETILVIDDELTLLDLTKEILEGLGYKVIAAEGAMSGIRAYEQRHSEVDLVILDMLMPEMTGNMVYPALKKVNPRVAVLLATGLSVGERVDDMISLGVNDIVAKPYSVTDLANHVRKVIDSRK